VSDPGSTKKNPLGPTGERVIANVKHLRQSKGMTYKELSERLDALGRQIPVLGLSRLERGERRVDVDDIVALALALDVTPNRLMMPDIDLRGVSISDALTPAVTGNPQALWTWAQGEEPLDTPLEPLEQRPGGRVFWFITANKPYLIEGAVLRGGGLLGRDADSTPGLLEKLGHVLGQVTEALESGLSGTEIRTAAELAIVRGLDQGPAPDSTEDEP
jgi:transcriptional regulator with XRE-family HTH domain